MLLGKRRSVVLVFVMIWNWYGCRFLLFFLILYLFVVNFQYGEFGFVLMYLIELVYLFLLMQLKLYVLGFCGWRLIVKSGLCSLFWIFLMYVFCRVGWIVLVFIWFMLRMLEVKELVEMVVDICIVDWIVCLLNDVVLSFIVLVQIMLFVLVLLLYRIFQFWLLSCLLVDDFLG